MRFIRIPIATKSEAEDLQEKYPQYTRESANWPYMEQIDNILKDLPDTWKAYPDTIKGRCDILAMEYNELQNAVSKEQKMHELAHVGAAALHLWSALAETK